MRITVYWLFKTFIKSKGSENKNIKKKISKDIKYDNEVELNIWRVSYRPMKGVRQVKYTKSNKYY